MNKKYTYTYTDYLRYRLSKKKRSVPDEVIKVINDYINDQHITTLNRTNIRRVLCNTNNLEYIENISEILSMINNPITSIDDTDCVICYETVNKMIKLRCGHIFCESCTKNICNDNEVVCPLCRNEQKFYAPQYIDDERIKKMLEYFNEHKDNYTNIYNDTGRHVPVDQIIDDINKKLTS